MNAETQNREIYKLLLTPIKCSKNISHIYKENGIIYSGQKYASPYADEDMSDFSIGFYDIIYRNLLDKTVLDDIGNLRSLEYAGDTMNSFNTVANSFPEAGSSRSKRTPEAQWPQVLRDYYKSYHCLANFWILPCEIGRDIKGNYNKAIRPVSDYMDRFLEMLQRNEVIVNSGREYFSKFKSWDDFLEIHFLKDSYVNKEGLIEKLSDGNGEMFILKAKSLLEHRAKTIAESGYASDLWNYFNSLDLI